MTEIIRVAERCARKNQTNLDSNSTQTSLKNVEKFGCAWNFDWNVSKLVEKIIFGFKTRRRVIENGLKQVKLVNNSGFQVSFERWMKFDQKWSGFSWFEKVEFVSNSFSWQNWLKSDEKVRGCLFFGSKLLEIVEVFSSSWWIELLFRVRSGFKISKVVSSSRIRSSFNWYRFSNFSTVLSCCEQRSRQNGRPHD